MAQSIVVTGTVRCPDGTGQPRREIAVGKGDTAKLPLNRFPVCTRPPSCPGTEIQLIAGEDAYDTRLHRFEESSYIADAQQKMHFPLGVFLQRHRLNSCRQKFQMEVEGYNFRINLTLKVPGSPPPRRHPP